jgi:hypothetical protein
MLGSGFVVGKSIRFRGPSHTLERLWVLSAEDSVWVSNSLPFILSVSGRDIPIANHHAEADLLAFIDGLHSRKRKIDLDDGSKLVPLVHADFQIGHDVQLRHSALAEPQVFSDYNSYVRELLNICTMVSDNAAAAARSLPFQPLATVSRGYDSPACAVLAAKCGAKRAMTFSHARAGYKMDDDDGTEIARHLQLSAISFSRTDYLADDPITACRFIASGGGGEDVVLAGAASLLKGSVLFTGFLGDTLWGLNGDPRQSSRLQIRYPGGGSIGEFRLHTGFVHLPIPILHLRSHETILAVSRSAEMQPFVVGGDYDRPIPRRIAEEAGVPRDAFGQSKMAITAPMYYDGPLDAFLNEEAITRFRRFLSRNAIEVSLSRERYAAGRQTRQRIRVLLDRVSWRASSIGLRGLATLTRARLSDRWRRAPSDELFLTHWGVSEVKRLYDASLNSTGTAA